MNILSSPRDYVSFWFGKKGMTAREATLRGSTFGTMYLDYMQTHAQSVIQAAIDGVKVKRPLEERSLRFAYDEFLDLTLAGEVKVAASEFTFNGGGLELLKTWIKAVTGAVSEKDISVLAHWCWLVKRKACDLPVKHQIMPIIYGKQGGGKTMALEQLIHPLEKFRLNLQMTSLGDERMYKGFSTNLVVLFDELQNIERTNVNVLKNQITTTFNTFRPMHTNSIVNSPMRCSFIGASNKPINENFSDSTGMRRFYQLNALERLDWSVINTIDYKLLWQAINETLPDGYLTGEMLTQVQQLQTALVNKDEFTTFLEECEIMPVEGKGAKLVTSRALYNSYKDWCGHNGARAYSSVYFNTRLKNLGLKYQVSTTGRKAYYTVHESATVDVEAASTPNLVVIK